MILKNINIINREGAGSIVIKKDRIGKIIFNDRSGLQEQDEFSISFDEAIAFPGLINSHDHLEFNLFPKLANDIYKNYLEWGADIHRQNKDIINSIKTIPKLLRAEWGMYKNLLNGVTTVVQHGEYFNFENPIIDIFQDSFSFHSVMLEKKFRIKLINPFKKRKPIVIHIGEGTDQAAYEEINELIRWNLFKKKLIGIHGISMTENQAKSFEALIWCPESNLFLFNKTAVVNKLKKETKILFGTDSTLTAGWNLWDQIRLARKTNMLTDSELFDSITSIPATVWGLKGKGILKEGNIADIVVAQKPNSNDSINNFFEINPADLLLVIKNGKIILFDQSLITQMKGRLKTENFRKIFINNVPKFITGNLPLLIAEIKKYSSEARFPIETE